MASVKTTIQRLLILAISVVGVLLALPAHAEDKAAARDHWERGTKFYDLGKYDEAIREFEAAYQAKSDPAFLYNLAQSHRLAGHSSDALRFYRTYLRNNPKASNRADIEQRIAELEKVTSERPSASEPPPVVVSPATTKTTTTTAESSSTAPPPIAGPGSSSIWNGGAVTPPPLTADSSFTGGPSSNGLTGTAPEPSTAQPRSRRKTAAVVIAASGGAVFLVGALFGSVARSQSNKVETSAQNGEMFDPNVESLGKSSETLQWFGYGLGVAAIATGVVLYLTAPKPENAASRVALAPMVSPQSGGALMRVTF